MLTHYLCFIIPCVVITTIFSITDVINKKPNLIANLIGRWLFTMTFIHIIFGILYLCGVYNNID